MSYVKYSAGNLTTTGTYCYFDGVSCHTDGVTYSNGNLETILATTDYNNPCPQVVYYSSGNLVLVSATCGVV